MNLLCLIGIYLSENLKGRADGLRDAYYLIEDFFKKKEQGGK